MVAFSGRSRVPSGEARPPVKEAPQVGAGKAGRAGGVRLGAWGEGAAKEDEENKTECPGEQPPSRPDVRTSALLPSRSPALQPLSQKCPPDVRGLPPRRGFRGELRQPAQSQQLARAHFPDG